VFWGASLLDGSWDESLGRHATGIYRVMQRGRPAAKPIDPSDVGASSMPVVLNNPERYRCQGRDKHRTGCQPAAGFLGPLGLKVPPADSKRWRHKEGAGICSDSCPFVGVCCVLMESLPRKWHLAHRADGHHTRYGLDFTAEFRPP
jgi:hypothetical protein